MSFKLTYSTMFDPPEEMHDSFEAALAEVRAGLGATHTMYIDGQDVAVELCAENRSPVDQRVILVFSDELAVLVCGFVVIAEFLLTLGRAQFDSHTALWFWPHLQRALIEIEGLFVVRFLFFFWWLEVGVGILEVDVGDLLFAV